MLCKNCEQPLIEIEFAKGFEIVCDNWRCYLYRQSQGCRPTELRLIDEGKAYQRRHDIGNPARKVFSSGPMAGGTHSSACSLAMPSYLVRAYFSGNLGGTYE